MEVQEVRVNLEILGSEGMLVIAQEMLEIQEILDLGLEPEMLEIQEIQEH